MNLFLSFGIISILLGLLSLFTAEHKIISAILLVVSLYFGFTTYQTEICGMIGLLFDTTIVSTILIGGVINLKDKKK